MNLQGGTGTGTRVGAQTLTGPEPALKFERLAVSTLDDSAHANTFYIHSTFRITNVGSEPVRNLTFLPTNTDEDSDPATPTTSTPTVGTTPFKNLRYYDGSDASEQAPYVQLGQVRKLDTQTYTSPTVVDDDTATLYRQNLQAPGFQTSVPTGLTAQVGSAGWVHIGTLAPGESTILQLGAGIRTFGFTSKPYNLDVVLAVAQDDASTEKTPLAAPVFEYDRTTSTVSAWTGGAGSAQVRQQFLSSVDPNSYVAATASISSAGQLDLRLASERELVGLNNSYPGNARDYNREGCTTTVTSSDPRIRTLIIDMLGITGKGDSRIIIPARRDSLKFSEGTAFVESGLLIYADRPGTLNGTYSCDLDGGWSPFQITLENVQLVKGWNKLQDVRTDTVLTTPEGTLPLESHEISNGPFPEEWLYFR
ncbi:hypothetical protein Dcar01_00762 [Deinococcus carri]|uniref:Uncharacterized protein n=1 Tax=Deinococcus carri TaxID=1211323 RepID=A0ABP9W7T7_9DEIO